MAIIYKADNITEAHIIKGMLEANDIPASVGGFYLQGGVGEMAAADFAHVHVGQEDVERAKLVIAEYEGQTETVTDEVASRIEPKPPASLFSRVMFALMVAGLVIILVYFVSFF